MVVSRIDAVLVRHELLAPVRLGRQTITARDVVSVKLETSDGLTGFATGASRGTPVLEAVRALAPTMIGADPLAREAIVEHAMAPFGFGRPAMLRALALLDIALWDVAALAADLPMFRLLGGARTRVPALQVCGYGLEAEGEASVLDELRHFTALGFKRLKVMLAARDVSWTGRFLERCRTAIPPEIALGVDFMYSLEQWGMAETTRLCRLLDELDLAFIEDPFDSALWRQYARLASIVRTPLVTGEDISHLSQFVDLLQSLSLIRVDPLTAEGVTGARKAIALAGAFGARVLPHGHQALNAALAGAFLPVDCIEVAMAPDIEPGASIAPDCAHRFDRGDVVLDEQSGGGLRLDWDELARCARARWSSRGP